MNPVVVKLESRRKYREPDESIYLAVEVQDSETHSAMLASLRELETEFLGDSRIGLRQRNPLHFPAVIHVSCELGKYLAQGAAAKVGADLWAWLYKHYGKRIKLKSKLPTVAKKKRLPKKQTKKTGLKRKR